MKKLSKNQTYFGLLALVFSIVFFYLLGSAIKEESYTYIWLYAIIFGTLLFASGFFLGYHDPVRESRTDLGFGYHLITFLVVNAIGIPWMLFTLGFSSNSIFMLGLQVVPWGLGLLLHYYFSSRSIKGMSKEEIFA